jgi:hypothetical protein
MTGQQAVAITLLGCTVWLMARKAVCALHFAYYNFSGIHKSLRVTPAMKAGIADHIWNLKELLA